MWSWLLHLTGILATVEALSLAPPRGLTDQGNPFALQTMNLSYSKNESQYSSDSDIPSTVMSNQSDTLFVNAVYQCDHNTYGNPSPSSCLDAHRQMESTSQSKNYADRESGHAIPGLYSPLPYRYTSGDGTCVIELSPRLRGGHGIAVPKDIKRQTRALMGKCMGQPLSWSVGGVALYLGTYGSLTVTVKESHPNVKCFNPQGERPVWTACPNVLNAMPTSTQLKIFGEQGTPDVDEELPHTFSYALLAQRECVIDIVIDGPPIQAQWYQLWTAANAITAVCARQGKDGVVTHIVGDTELAVWVSGRPIESPVATS